MSDKTRAYFRTTYCVLRAGAIPPATVPAPAVGAAAYALAWRNAQEGPAARFRLAAVRAGDLTPGQARELIRDVRDRRRAARVAS